MMQLFMFASNFRSYKDTRTGHYLEDSTNDHDTAKSLGGHSNYLPEGFTVVETYVPRPVRQTRYVHLAPLVERPVRSYYDDYYHRDAHGLASPTDSYAFQTISSPPGLYSHLQRPQRSYLPQGFSSARPASVAADPGFAGSQSFFINNRNFVMRGGYH